MEKNQGGKWIVFAFEDEGGTNPGEPVTGDAANITANVRIDGGAANAVDDTNPTELEDGYYIFDITAAESNGDLILICPASSTANVNVIGVPGAIYTQPANFQALGIESDGDLTKVNTLDGHTAQTGDSYALASGATGFAAIDTVVDAILTAVITNAAGTDIAADIIALKAETVLIVADTGELQTDWANGGRLDLILDTAAAAGAPANILQNTTIATLASQTSFTLTAGSADDDAYNGRYIIVTDQTTGAQKAVGTIKDYTGATKTVTLNADPGIFTMATGDTVDIVVNADPAIIAVPGSYVAGTWGYIVGTNLDATVSSAGGSTGSITHTITVTVSGSPVDNVGVRITSDSAGAVAVSGPKYTNSIGEVAFDLDAGTYYSWFEHAGYTFSNPQTETVA